MHQPNELLGPLTQLQAFADFESKHRPGKSGQTHIAQWAVEEIERLMAENASLSAELEKLYELLED